MNSPKDQPVVIIAGPTASGKSALALELAAAFGGADVTAQTRRDTSDATADMKIADAIDKLRESIERAVPEDATASSQPSAR